MAKIILFLAFSFTNTINWKKKRTIGRKLAVHYFACRYRIYLGCVLFYLFYFEFTAFPHIAICAMWVSSDVRCRFLEHFFLALSCFGSGGTGLASPRRSASASVPEPCSSRHAAWLQFADFCSSGDCVSNPVFHNSPWHRRLACTCRGSQLFSFLEVLVNNSCNPFLSMILLGLNDSMPSADAFVLYKIFSRSMFDDVWWPILINGNTRELHVSSCNK